TGDAAFFNKDGQVGPGIMPPSGVWKGVPTSQVENPNPQSGLSNPNWYTEDGYRGGSYVNCADTNQPSVQPISGYLTSLGVKPNCADNTYYLLNNYLKDVSDLFAVLAAGTLPAVAYVRPWEQMAGHPANAAMAPYENFTTNPVNLVHDQTDLWNSTAILITVDEGGGYYDSGYI